MEYKVKDRLNNQIIIKESKINIFLYTTKLGRILLKIIVLPFISKIVGIYQNSIFSKNMIPKFIKNNHINMNDYEKTVAYNYVEQLENVLAHDDKLTFAACKPDVEPFLEENHKYLFNPDKFYFTTESDSLMTAVENTYAMLKKVLLLILLFLGLVTAVVAVPGLDVPF